MATIHFNLSRMPEEWQAAAFELAESGKAPAFASALKALRYAPNVVLGDRQYEEFHKIAKGLPGWPQN